VEAADDLQLIERHVAAFNHGVRTGDWEPMLAGLAPDATMHFPGLALAGIDAIRAAYAENPPDDTIVLLDLSGRLARFRWERGGGTGTMTFELADELVTSLAVGFDEG
jgi:SnoaL-like domain